MGPAGPAPRKRRTEDHALVFGEDWEVPSAPQPKKTAAPPPPVPVPAPSGVYDTVESAWATDHVRVNRVSDHLGPYAHYRGVPFFMTG